MIKSLISDRRQPDDIINFRIIILWGIFAVLYFALCFLYFGDILASDYKTIHKVHAVFAFLSHALLCSGIGAVIFIFMSRKIGNPAISVLFSLSVTVVVLLTLTDIALFRIYHFHINRYVISEIMQPDFSRSSGIGSSFIIISLMQSVFAAVLISAGAFLFIRSAKPVFGLPSRRAIRLVIIIVLSAVIIEKVFMILVSYNRPAYIYELQESMPVFYASAGEYLYNPIKSHINITDEKESYDVLSSEYRKCAYPLQSDINTAKIGNAKNIIFILTESTRWDVIDKTTTPAIFNLSRSNSIVSDYHFSGSNSTHLGLFSILYGINPYFNVYVKTKKTESFPIRALRDKGYRTHLFMSASPQWHRMDLFLNQNFDDIYTPSAQDPITRDAEITREVVKRIGKMNGKSELYFIFLDSSHYPFYFPEQQTRFTPYFKGQFDKTDFMMLNSNKNLLMNSYRNSLHYLDSLIENIVSSLKTSGHYDDTIIVYSSDHGCEFGETGRYFYSSSLSSYATQVPLIIHDPSLRKSVRAELSSHIDIFPTIFDLIGYTGDRTNFAGKSLLSSDRNPYAIVTYQDVLTPYKYSIIDGYYKMIVDFKSAGFIVARTGRNDLRAESIPDESKRLSFLKRQMRMFTRHDRPEEK